MLRLSSASVLLAFTALLTGCGAATATSVTPAAVSSAQGEQLAVALAAINKYGPSCQEPGAHLATVLPSLVGLGKGTLLTIDALPLLTTAQTDLTADAAASAGLSVTILAAADDLGRIRVALANLKTADLEPLTTHLQALARGCGVD